MRSIVGLIVAGMTRAALVLAVVLLAAGSASAANRNWGSGSTASWFTPGNWTELAVPAAGDGAIVNQGGTVQIASGIATCGLAAAEGQLVIDSLDGGLGGNLEVNSDGVLNMNSAGIFVGAAGVNQTLGTMTMNGGVVTNLGRYFEVARNGKGQLTVNSGTIYHRGFWLLHYDPGTPVLARIDMNGGQIIRDSMSGNYDFIISAVGSGTGTVTMTAGLIDDVRNGAFNRALSIGGLFNQSGGTSKWYAVTLSGAASAITLSGSARFEAGVVGYGDDTTMKGGTLNVNGGTFVGAQEQQLYVGEDVGNTGTVNITAGSLIMAANNNNIYLGSDALSPQNGPGVGYLNMSGGYFLPGRLRVGGANYSRGEANFSGGTFTNASGNMLSIGYGTGATGTVTISGSHVYVQTYETRIGEGVNSVGTLNMTGGTVTNDGSAYANVWYGYGAGSRTYGTLTGGDMTAVVLALQGLRSEVTMGGTFKLNAAVVSVGAGSPCYGELTITNSAALSILGSMDIGVNNSGATGVVTMAGGTLNIRDYLAVARNGTGRFTLTDGTLQCGRIYTSQYLAGPAAVNLSGGTLIVTNGARLAGNATYPANLDLAGGLLDLRVPASTAELTVYAGNTVTNRGGILQFTRANPLIYESDFVAMSAAGRVVIDGGTVSFRNIVNADVRCNQSGYPLAYNTKVAWAGTANGFRLNTATNVSSSQAYTFTSGAGSTNFARLDLMNGSLYQGGNVTIGSGGTLTVTGGVSTISNDLTFQSGSTYAVQLGAPASASKVVVSSGNVALGGAALTIQLTAAPQKDYQYVIIDNAGATPVSGQFASGYATASYGGTNYTFSIHTNRGTGNDVVAGWFTKGTVFYAQ